MRESNKTEQTQRWRAFAGDMVVPVLLGSYATHYYFSVASLPRPETNLLLIGPVYWLLMICCAVHVTSRFWSLIGAAKKAKTPIESVALDSIPPMRAVAFLGMTLAYIWAIPILGFATATVVYCGLMLRALGVTSLRTLALIPLLLAGALWVSLAVFLNLALPRGLLI